MYRTVIIFSIFSSRNFPISPHSKAASTLRGYLMKFKQQKNICTNVWNNVMHDFSFLQSKQLRTSV